MTKPCFGCENLDAELERAHGETEALRRRLVDQARALHAAGAALGQAPGESLVGAAERARDRIAVLERHVADLQVERARACRALGAHDGDCLAAAIERADLARLLEERALIRIALGVGPAADLVEAARDAVEERATTREQEAAMRPTPAPVDPLGRDFRRRYYDRADRREAAIERASGRLPVQEPPLVAGGEDAIAAGWVTLAAVVAAAALIAAALLGAFA